MPVLAPAMVAIGGVFPVEPREYSVTAFVVEFARTASLLDRTRRHTVYQAT